MPASINLSLLAGSFGFKLPTLFENSFFKKKKLLLLWKVYCSYMTARDISLTQDTNYRTEKRSNYQYRNNVRDSTTEPEKINENEREWAPESLFIFWNIMFLKNALMSEKTLYIGAWCVARVLLQPTMWGQRGVQSGWQPSSSCSAGLVATADSNAATAVPMQPPLAELDFWKVQLPASLRVPLGYSEFAM